MKLVLISDTHGAHRDVLLPEGDVLIHAGDICDSLNENLDQQRRQVEDFDLWIGEQKDKRRKFKKAICIAGNHDFPFARSPFQKLKNAVYLQNESFIYDGVKFFGSPQQLPFYGAFNSSEVELERIYKKVDKDVDVLITHTPPYGILDKSFRGKNVGSKSLISVIEEIKPKVHVFGHVHFGYGEYEGEDTKFFNVSQVGKLFTRIDNKPLTIEI